MANLQYYKLVIRQLLEKHILEKHIFMDRLYSQQTVYSEKFGIL